MKLTTASRAKHGVIGGLTTSEYIALVCELNGVEL